MKYKVLVCCEVWGTIEVEADNADKAKEMVEEGEYESGFVPNGKLGNIGVYSAEPETTALKEETK